MTSLDCRSEFPNHLRAPLTERGRTCTARCLLLAAQAAAKKNATVAEQCGAHQTFVMVAVYAPTTNLPARCLPKVT